MKDVAGKAATVTLAAERQFKESGTTFYSDYKKKAAASSTPAAAPNLPRRHVPRR